MLKTQTGKDCPRNRGFFRATKHKDAGCFLAHLPNDKGRQVEVTADHQPREGKLQHLPERGVGRTGKAPDPKVTFF